MGKIFIFNQNKKTRFIPYKKIIVKIMKKSTLGDYKSLKRVLKYVWDTRNLSLVFVENFEKFNHFIMKNIY